MKFRVLIAGAFVCLAATACGTVSHASVKAGSASLTQAGHAATVAVVSHVASKPVVFDCLNHAIVKPGNYTLTCADGGSDLAGLSWIAWTPELAVANGVHELNNCTPNCAEGTFVHYPAVITFSRPEPLAGHPGESYFSRITVRYTTAKRPPMYLSNGQYVRSPAEWTQTLGS
jgi:hypothetical protein